MSEIASQAEMRLPVPMAHDNITESNMRKSPLLRLLGELRNKIYKATFESHALVIQEKKAPCCGTVAFLTCCRQIYREARENFCLYTTFKIHGCPEESEASEDAFTQLLQENRMGKIVKLALNEEQASFIGFQLTRKMKHECNAGPRIPSLRHIYLIEFSRSPGILQRVLDGLRVYFRDESITISSNKSEQDLGAALVTSTQDFGVGTLTCTQSEGRATMGCTPN